MYTTFNYKSKKELRNDVVALKTTTGKEHDLLARRLLVYSPGPFEAPSNGTCALEGPHYPAPHRWYASATIEDGIVVKVR
jgi:hypothetical protein